MEKSKFNSSSVIHKVFKAIFIVGFVIILLILPIRLYILKCEMESKIELVVEMECYGNYLAAYDLYMEVYGVMGDWKDVYNMAEERKEKHKNQQRPQTINTGVIYKLYPGPVPRF